MRSSEGALERLFELIYNKNPNVSRQVRPARRSSRPSSISPQQATALVFVVCEFSEDGFDVVNKAAKARSSLQRVAALC